MVFGQEMISVEDFNQQNFQSLLANYDGVIKDVTSELNSIQNEQTSIQRALKENSQLSSDLNRLLVESANPVIEHTYKEGDLIENLKLQLQNVLEEKENVTKLWQSAVENVEHLEQELGIYQHNTDGFIPKSKLVQLKTDYDRKLTELQGSVSLAKSKLEETINVRSKELDEKNKEIFGVVQSRDNTLKIVQNLEEEVLSLQKRLNDGTVEKQKLQQQIKVKNQIEEALKERVKECKLKVEESLQVVEAALREKDAALLREAAAQEEVAKLSKSFSDFIEETNTKVKTIKTDYNKNLEQLEHKLNLAVEENKGKSLEANNHLSKCIFLEKEVERLQKTQMTYEDSSNISKILTLEKNREETFQKLLLSEKENIKLKAEVANIKSDLDQMSRQYDRDVKGRDSEKTALKADIIRLKNELEESYVKLSSRSAALDQLNENIVVIERNFKEQIDATKNAFQQTRSERQDMEIKHNELILNLQEQLEAQTANNKKWRIETKNLIEQLEGVITELKTANVKVKQENKALQERIRESNVKMLEYKKFLEMISKDVTKITSIAVPDRPIVES